MDPPVLNESIQIIWLLCSFYVCDGKILFDVIKFFQGD